MSGKTYQVISSAVIVFEEDDTRRVYTRGETIETIPAAQRDRYLELGAIRESGKGDEAPLPATNAGAVDTRPTQPDGTPIDADADGKPLVAGETGTADAAPSTHKEADAMLDELGVKAPSKATVAQKAEIISQVRAAGPAGAPVATEDLSDLDEGELIQRGVDFGLTEDELVELSKDELVLRVAEAMALRSSDPAVQARVIRDSQE